MVMYVMRYRKMVNMQVYYLLWLLHREFLGKKKQKPKEKGLEGKTPHLKGLKKVWQQEKDAVVFVSNYR